MKPNLSKRDRVVHGLVGLLVVTSAIGLSMMVPMIAGSLVLLVAATGYNPAYALLGINTDSTREMSTYERWLHKRSRR